MQSLVIFLQPYHLKFAEIIVHVPIIMLPSIVIRLLKSIKSTDYRKAEDPSRIYSSAYLFSKNFSLRFSLGFVYVLVTQFSIR